MIHLFRHAHAGGRKDWSGQDRERPLTERGWRESRLIAERLAGAGVSRIFTSPYLRCVQSVQPLSEAAGIPIEIEPALAEGADPTQAYGVLSGAGPGTLLCTHGDVVAALIEQFAAEGAELEGGPAWEKGSIWHLEQDSGGRVRAGRYQPPPLTTP